MAESNPGFYFQPEDIARGILGIVSVDGVWIVSSVCGVVSLVFDF